MFNYCPPKDLENLKSTTFPDGKRYYTLPDGTKLPSVTTVIGAKGKKAIMEWRKRVGEFEKHLLADRGGPSSKPDATGQLIFIVLACYWSFIHTGGNLARLFKLVIGLLKLLRYVGHLGL